MGCCGKNIVQKATHVAAGYSMAVMDRLFRLPEKTSTRSQQRLMACRACDHHTWMSQREYFVWIHENGGMAKFLKQIDALDRWPKLPKQECASNRRLFCRICKCWLPAKAYCKNETCPIGTIEWKA